MFVIPDAGGMLWSDNMMIPNNAQHKANAEAWMNYYYDPEVAAKLEAWVNYICPVDGAQEEMMKIDKSLAENPLIFPSQDDYAELSIFRALSDEEETSSLRSSRPSLSDSERLKASHSGAPLPDSGRHRGRLGGQGDGKGAPDARQQTGRTGRNRSSSRLTDRVVR